MSLFVRFVRKYPDSSNWFTLDFIRPLLLPGLKSAKFLPYHGGRSESNLPHEQAEGSVSPSKAMIFADTCNARKCPVIRMIIATDKYM